MRQLLLSSLLLSSLLDCADCSSSQRRGGTVCSSPGSPLRCLRCSKSLGTRSLWWNRDFVASTTFCPPGTRANTSSKAPNTGQKGEVVRCVQGQQQVVGAQTLRQLVCTQTSGPARRSGRRGRPGREAFRGQTFLSGRWRRCGRRENSLLLKATFPLSVGARPPLGEEPPP